MPIALYKIFIVTNIKVSLFSKKLLSNLNHLLTINQDKLSVS